ncbi:acyl-CoA dehydrogenase/oxidase C-terminal [Thozetella sp. PMI_491]|nr:acyl-CoA dehydrogenase/oxidase C-terminal [Thozetella sp. PMI_491]
MASANRIPSSSTSGFFQSLPSLPPQYTAPAATKLGGNGGSTGSDDAVMDRVFGLYLPTNLPEEVSNGVHKFSRRILEPKTLAYAVDAEVNHPVLRPLTTFGEENRDDPLWTTAGWKALKEIGIEEGVVSRAYDTRISHWNRRIQQFGLVHVWTSTSTLTMCPMSMTDGAATLLRRHLDDADGDQPGRGAVIREAYRRLTSMDPKEAWTSGQWMTERTGGSDVSGTETVATRLTPGELSAEARDGRMSDSVGMPLGPWRIDGFKWFSSATDSEMAVLLAQTPKGLSAFYAPMRRRYPERSESASELNGLRIQRLKDKMGTRGLPTAELELRGMRAWLLGEEGRGIKEIAAILNITRIHTAAGSVGYWARGLAVCRAYSLVRRVRGSLLIDNAPHVRWMAGETLKYWASTELSFFGIALLGASEQGFEAAVGGTRAEKLIPRDAAARDTLLRLLTPVMKAQCSMKGVEGLRSAMECLGGVGYCENNHDGGIMNMAKLFRDSVVQTIWEGTVNVMAEDVVRVVTDARHGAGNAMENVFGKWVRGVLDTCRSAFQKECDIVEERLQELLATANAKDKGELAWKGREILNHIEAITCACLLFYDATTDQDEVASCIALRWVRSMVSARETSSGGSYDWKEEARIDRLVFLGSRETSLSRI